MSDVEDTELEMKESDTREIQKLKENLAKQEYQLLCCVMKGTA